MEESQDQLVDAFALAVRADLDATFESLAVVSDATEVAKVVAAEQAEEASHGKKVARRLAQMAQIGWVGTQRSAVTVTG